MTTITVAILGRCCSLDAEGHASYGPCGSDIVCAGISSITYALAGYLENSRDRLDFGASLEMEMSSGKVHIACVGDVSEAFKLAYIGLAQLAEQFPENLSVDLVFPDAI